CGEPGEPLPAATPAAAPTASATPAAPSRMAAPPPPPSVPGEVLAAPAVRRLARELNVDLAAVRGSGPQGRITEDDVRRGTKGPVAPTRPAVAAAAPTGADGRLRIPGLRNRHLEG